MDEHSGNSVMGQVDDVHQRLLDRVRYLDLELRAVSIGLKSKLEKTCLIRDQLTQCMETVPVGVILVDQDGHVQRANGAARIICGWEVSDYEGRSLEALWKCLGWPPAPFTDLPVENRILSCWEEVLGTPGTVPCWTARFLSDSGRVLNETKEHSRERSLKSLGERVAKIAHDLRNSMSSVELLVSLVERRVCGDPGAHKIAQQLSRSVRSLELLVDNLSTSANPRKPKMKMISVNSLFDQIELLLAHPIQSHQIVLNRTIDSGAENILGDPILLTQACLNLVNNAIAASPRGGVINVDSRITFPPSNVVPPLTDQGYVRIQVQDFGCGIDPEDLPHVCQPFYSKMKSGTGLGLSIVRDVTDVHAGTVDIQSQKGQGTTVSLYFPRQRRLA
ncbi:MAG: ATP-binding protein [Nitrospirales bacterium]|nr:ATP-binding protein [Nitrospirales bacterium]